MDNKSLKEFLYFRLTHHHNHSVFKMYLWGIVIGIGGCGIWANFIPSLLKLDGTLINWENVSISIYTLFPSLAVSSWSEILLPEKVSRPVRLFAIVVVVTALLWMMLCINLPTILSILAGCVGYIAAVLSWVIAHGEDKSLDDNFDTDSTKIVSGDVNKPVQGFEGELKI